MAFVSTYINFNGDENLKIKILEFINKNEYLDNPIINKNGLSLEAEGPYASFKSLADFKIFENLLCFIPDSTFTGIIRGSRDGEDGEIPDKKYIVDLMKKYTDIPLFVDEKPNEVFNRRASTVRGWIEWIIGCQV